MFYPLRALLTAVLWQSSDGLNGSGKPKGSTAFAFKVFWVVFYQYQNVSILKDNLHLYLEHSGVNRILLQVGTLTVPSLCLNLCLWYIQKLFGDHELKHMWYFSCTKLCFGRVIICSRLRAGCWSCLRKMQLPKRALLVHMHMLAWCTLIIQLQTFSFSLTLRLLKTFCEVFLECKLSLWDMGHWRNIKENTFPLFWTCMSLNLVSLLVLCFVCSVVYETPSLSAYSDWADSLAAAIPPYYFFSF